MLSKIALSSDTRNSAFSGFVQTHCAVLEVPDDGAYKFFVRGRAGAVPVARHSPDKTVSLKAAWQDLERTVNSTCAGVVFRSQEDPGALTDLIGDAFKGEPLPGAIVVSGRAKGFLRRLTEIAAVQMFPFTIRLKSGLTLPFEWPPILVISDFRDPDLPANLSVCHRLRDHGLPVEMSVQEDAGNLDGRTADLIEGFFQRYLLEHFPKML
ncbi:MULTISPECIES: hypothetical protein [Neorhizobium]|uniref:hypothetical protein n=1 Tax=Neorhizobium TaxID=1525371 RepID=UPI000CF8AC1D|nr:MULTISPECIES: hypothetical protein [Neorhizobium]